MSIGRVCSRVVHSAQPGETVRDAAARMKQNNVGTLIVLDATQRPIGILTDRDLVVRVMAEGRPLTATRVDAVMTQHPRTVTEHMPIEDVLAQMRLLGVRRLPVVNDDGQLVGIVSVDDVLELLAGELGNVGRVVARSAPGAVAPVPTPMPDRPVSPAKGRPIGRAAGDPEC